METSKLLRWVFSELSLGARQPPPPLNPLLSSLRNDFRIKQGGCARYRAYEASLPHAGCCAKSGGTARNQLALCSITQQGGLFYF